MVITTTKGVWIFSAITTVIAFLMALVLIIVSYGGHPSTASVNRAAFISVVIAVPISYWVGRKIRENSLLTQELQRLVDRDRLTDLATRDYFFGRMADNPDAVGVSLMIDIDCFKAINDRYGHFAGDAVIRQVATLLRSLVRAQDIVCRFGGEEFIIFLFGYHVADGTAAADELRRRIAETPIRFEGTDIDVTVSIGGSLKQHAVDISEAIREADAALYRAKRLGRNRTIFQANGGSSAA